MVVGGQEQRRADGLKCNRGLTLGLDVFRALPHCDIRQQAVMHTFEGRDWSGPVETSQLSYCIEGHFVFSSEEPCIEASFDIHRRFLEVWCTPQCLDRL